MVAEDPRWPPIAQRRARKVKVLSNYKFYLAFENAAFEDYVSEKVRDGDKQLQCGIFLLGRDVLLFFIFSQLQFAVTPNC